MGMNPEIKAEWIRRLRSGDYEQGRGALCRDNTYCCLGVLSEIASERRIVDRVELVDVDFTFMCYSEDTTTLPVAVQDWVGISSGVGRFMLPGSVKTRDDRTRLSLAMLNDTGFTFSQIADIIEAFF